jgi:hypothetical protein
MRDPSYFAELSKEGVRASRVIRRAAEVDVDVLDALRRDIASPRGLGQASLQAG